MYGVTISHNYWSITELHVIIQILSLLFFVCRDFNNSSKHHGSRRKKNRAPPKQPPQQRLVAARSNEEGGRRTIGASGAGGTGGSNSTPSFETSANKTFPTSRGLVSKPVRFA